jgi:soluble lytic murein transglycosylase
MMAKQFLKAACVLVLGAAVAACVPANAANEDEFLSARDAFRAGDARKLDFHARRMSNYILEPYVAYWQLRLRLDEASASDVRRFMGTYGDTPVSRSILTDWLRLLGRSQQWDQFDLEYPLYTGDDADIACYAIQSRLRAGNAGALADARPMWFLPKELPDSCTPVFNALAQNQRLTEDDVWARIRVGLEAGQVALAHRASQYLPQGQGPDYRTLTLITSNPAGYLDKQQFDLRARAGRETAMYAAHRLSRTAPQQAAAQWVRLENRFSPEERAYVWGQIAYFGALRHDPDVLTWFSRARDMSDLQLAWKARSALRQRNWKEVQAAIDAMSDKEREQATWKYWKARALKASGRDAEALVLLKPLAREYNFYGQLALEELGERISTPPAAFKPGPEELRAIGDNLSIRRALELYRLNLRVEGVREWIWAIRTFDDRQLITAAEVARRHELYDRAINTADRTESLHDFSLRYLAPFREVLRVRSSQMGLDEAWVYGLIRQESRFIADARSRVGASGLMQLMPATAKWVAGKMGLRNIADVTEVDTNVSLGTYYLRHVLDSLDSQPVLASAAYNAGPGRARAWRPDIPLEGAIYAESIPFNETRDYVKKVMSNASYYAHSFSRELQSLKQRMGVIAPRQRAREPSLGDTP